MECFLDLHMQQQIYYSFIFGNVFFITKLFKNQLNNLVITRLLVDISLVQDIKIFISQLGAYMMLTFVGRLKGRNSRSGLLSHYMQK